ncbi:MAG: DUF1565 domain-containing protein [Candidatus Korarchaeota archaeon]|nr:DUF1565 domain-containing protein [Candidatus Korarchaeota archaeon]
MEAGANGKGTRENPAGNITYILTNNASANDVINVKPGTYSTTIGETFPLNLTHPDITLTATEGPSATIINGTGNTWGIYVTASDITINDFTIINTTTGIYLGGSNDHTITNNTISNPSNVGILLRTSNRNTIAGNTISNTHFGVYAYSSGKTMIAGNTIAHTEDGIYLLHPDENNTIYGNVMKQCGIVLFGSSVSFTSQRIAENNTVNGKPVYYYKNQDMQGASIPSDAGQVILGNVTGLTIKDVNVSGGSVGILLGYSSNITITGNMITTNTEEGIYLVGSSGNMIVSNTLTDNSDGIVLEEASGNTITENTITNNPWYGVYLCGYTNGNTIANNSITSNMDGIRLLHSINTTVAGNTISSNTGDGILLYASNNTTITGNTITSNLNNGIWMWDSSLNNTIRSNHITSNEYGVYVYAGSDNVFTENIISENADGMYLSGSSEHNRVYRNNFLGNSHNAWDEGTGNTFNSSTIGNYWDDYTGEDTDGDGIGETPYDVPPSGGSRDYLPVVEPNNIVDSEPPTLTVTAPTEPAINASSVTVEWTGSDNLGIHYYMMRKDGDSWTKLGITTIYFFAGLSEGSHTIDVKAYDIAGNTNTKSVTFTIDVTGPSIEITSPDDGATLDETMVRVVWSASDDVSGIDRCRIQLDGGAWLPLSTATTSYEFEELSEEVHTVRVRVIDKAGNSAEDTLTFTVDTGFLGLGLSLEYVAAIGGGILVMIVTSVLLGIFLVRHLGDPLQLWGVLYHARLKALRTTIATSLQHLLRMHDRKTTRIQNRVEATVDELGTRLEGSLRNEDKHALINLVRETFYILGKRFDVTWKKTWTVGEFMSTLIERAGPAYANLLEEGYRHYEELLYAERAEWRETFQAIHHVLVKMTEKLRANPSSPTER